MILRSLVCYLLNKPRLTVATGAVISMSWRSGKREVVTDT